MIVFGRGAKIYSKEWPSNLVERVPIENGFIIERGNQESEGIRESEWIYLDSGHKTRPLIGNAPSRKKAKSCADQNLLVKQACSSDVRKPI